MRILCELRFGVEKEKLNYFNSIGLENVIINIIINNNVKGLRRERKGKHIVYMFCFGHRVTKIRIAGFWSSGRPVG